MAGAATIYVKQIALYERDLVLRMPFRFGSVTMREAPQMFVKLDIEDQHNRRASGFSAEVLAPKWFDKDPSLSNEDNFEQLRASMRKAQDAYLRSGPTTPFLMFADNYEAQNDVPADQQLVSSFGQALLDRAVMDALCRLEEMSFYTAIKQNRAGIVAHDIAPDLNSADIDSFLSRLEPSQSIAARHTVGLADPLNDNPEPVGDHLPETLVEVVRTYGNRYYKLKLSGVLDKDVERLCQIAAILEQHRPDYLASLDGNEQFPDVESFVVFLGELKKKPELKCFLERILFIEQPIVRSSALSATLPDHSWLKPIIIDESDCALGSFPRAIALGYRGVSSKSCKGLYKALINLYRCRKAGPDYFLSGEDLTMQAGIAVQQDLALVSLLGLRHVERNGHHYANGLEGVGRDEQQRFLAAHSDLYCDSHGVTRLDIVDGSLNISSLDCPGFASRALPDTATMRPVG